MNIKALKLGKNDNVATVIAEVSVGDICKIYFNDHLVEEVIAKTEIPPFHKIALVNIKESEPVMKYNENIGKAHCDISLGELVHSHNLKGNRGRGDVAKSNNK